MAIGITSGKIIGKYRASGVNYAYKSFIILVIVANLKNLFLFVIDK
jgi:hypothetical protein